MTEECRSAALPIAGRVAGRVALLADSLAA